MPRGDLMANIVLAWFSCSSSGVIALAKRLSESLKNDGNNVIELHVPCMPGKAYLWSLLKARGLLRIDAIIHLNNLCSPLCIISPKRAVFIHGYIVQEHSRDLFSNFSLFKSILALRSLLGYLKSIHDDNTSILCHSISACEANNIDPRSSRVGLIPQFISPKEERRLFSELKEEKAYDLMVYTSSVESPRLLSRSAIYGLIRLLANMRDAIRVIIVDPKRKTAKQLSKEGAKILLLPRLPYNRFIKLLEKTKIYLERNLDEEIGFTSLEAILHGTAVAKLTPKNLCARCDYSSTTLILSDHLHGLASVISDALENDTWMKYLVSEKRWVYQNRRWINVRWTLYKVLFSS